MSAKAKFLGLGLVSAIAAYQPVAYSQNHVIRYHEYPGNIVNLVSWVMKEKGFCERQHLDCQPVTLAAGPLAQQAAAAGSLDLVYSSADVMIQAIAKGNDLIIVQPQITNNVYSLVTAADVAQPNRTKGYPAVMHDLKGLKIGVSARGSATELQARALFVGAGMSPDSATYVAVGAPGTAYAALVAKQIGAALSWDPINAICGATHVCGVSVDMRKGQGPANIKAMNGSFVNWYARREFVEKNEATVDAFRRASDEATEWMKDPKNLGATLDVAKEHIKLGDEIPNRDAVLNQIVREMIAEYGTSFRRSSIEGFNEFLVANNMIAKPLDVDRIVYRKLLGKK